MDASVNVPSAHVALDNESGEDRVRTPGESGGRSASLRLAVYGATPDEVKAFEAEKMSGSVLLLNDSPSVSTAIRSLDYPCVSVNHKTPITPAIMSVFREQGVRHLSTRSIGTDHIDLQAAESLGIEVTNTWYEPDGVADYTLMLILLSLRGGHLSLMGGIHDTLDLQLQPRSRELRDLTVGVLGAGSIGRAVIRRLEGFGCHILASSTHDADIPGATFVSAEQLIKSSDVLTVHVPSTVETRRLLTAERLAGMKDGAILVNTSRGDIVKTTDLLGGLQSGKLSAVALDVVEGELALHNAQADRFTREQFDRLRNHPKVIVTPHIAYHTDRALRATISNTVRVCTQHG